MNNIFKSIVLVNQIRKQAKNWIKVSFYLMRGCSEYSINFRDGDIAKVSSFQDLARLISSKKFNLNFESRKGVGDFSTVFIYEDYKFLDPQGKIVVDIGAEIGDSSLYFAVRGAKKVITIEPFPYNFQYLQKNIVSNNFTSKIEALNVILGDACRNTFIDVGKQPIVRDAKESKSGYAIDMVTLEYLVNKNGIENGVLKMDCEGCEYNLLKCDNDIISRFEKIQIEYHYGLTGLVSKLEDCGFKVKYTKPKKTNNNDATNPKMEIGYIYAKKR